MTSQRPDRTKPRLLVLASTYPRWKADPEPAFVHELCRRLTRVFEVTVVCPAAPGTRLREDMDDVNVIRFRYAPGPWQTLVNDGGITTNLKRHPWKYLLVPSFVLAMLGSTIVELWRWRPGVLHAHWLVPQGLVAVVARWFAGGKIRLVVTSHGADLHGWRRWPFSWAKRLVLREADALTVVSRAMAREAATLEPAAAPAHVAPMGVDLAERFRPDANVARSTEEILFVGRLVEKKGLRHLIEAMPAILAQVPGARLLVAGFGPEERARKVQVETLGLGNAVRFLGAVQQSELPNIYRTAAVFVAPFVEAAGGDRDGLGLVLVEAAACGCPVVVSDLPAVHDVFDSGEACLVRPGDPRAVADAVVAVLKGTATLRRPDAGSLAERFGWQAIAARYAALLFPGSEANA